MDSGLGLSMLALFKVIVYKYKVNKQNINKQNINKQNINKQSLCNRLRKIAIARFVLQKLLMFLDLKKGFTIIWEGSKDLELYSVEVWFIKHANSMKI